MRSPAIFFLFLGLIALGEPVSVTPILSIPQVPRYFEWVLGAIENAEEEILIMLSDCRRYARPSRVNTLLDALAEAAGRGVQVKVLLERRDEIPPEEEAAFAYLEKNGIEVRWDDPESTLHAKLLVFDRTEVVLGSTPWTYNGLFESVQVDFAVRSPTAAQTFRRFFGFLWEGRYRVEPRLGEAKAPALILLPEFPEGEALHLEVAARLLEEAQKEIDLCLYMLRRYPWDSPVNRLTDALISAAARGVRVRVLLEGGESWMEPDFASDAREVATYLLLHGVEARFDPPGSTLHAKFLVVDGEDLLVSSANWAYYSLIKNVEAGVALLGTPALGSILADFFEALWAQARPLP